MQLYSVRATSQARVEWGLEAIVGLGQSPETKPLIPVVVAANEKVQAAMQVRQQSENAAIGPRVAVRFADYYVDQQLRSTWRACEIADGCPRGPIASALFPDGLSPLVAPSGPGQAVATQQFLIRARACRVAGAKPVLEEWIPRVEDALARLTSALQAREVAFATRAAALAAEDAARLDHLITMDKLGSEVRALYPKDRKRVDLVFPPASCRPRAKQAANDEDLPTPTEEG
jgi:hypothetical protein